MRGSLWMPPTIEMNTAVSVNNSYTLVLGRGIGLCWDAGRCDGRLVLLLCTGSWGYR